MVKDLKKKKKMTAKMSPLDKLIMKTLIKKIVQILLDIRSSFIWNSADGHY